jgi:hypothetical protein
VAKRKQKLGGEPLRKGLVKVKGMFERGQSKTYKIKEADAIALLSEDNETNYPAHEGW